MEHAGKCIYIYISHFSLSAVVWFDNSILESTAAVHYDILSGILIIKPTRCTNFQIYFWNRTLHVSDRFSAHHQESSTVLVYTAIGIYHTGFVDCLLAGSGWNWVPSWSRFCKNKFEKLVHLVGFIIRIYHDARSSECQILSSVRTIFRVILIRFNLLIIYILYFVEFF
jgi:hypothetical protein